MSEEFVICIQNVRRDNSQALDLKIQVSNYATVAELLLRALDATGLKHKTDEAYGFSQEQDSLKIDRKSVV